MQAREGAAGPGKGEKPNDHLPGDEHPRRQSAGHGEEAAYEPSSSRRCVVAHRRHADSLRLLLRSCWVTAALSLYLSFLCVLTKSAVTNTND